ncbi:MAG TPA: hypothetical protein VKG23_01015 [Thermoanaerobaculia bacterium]|nr:hypothetical protein [Thermoanaerobaculia bacterium]
MLSHNYSYSEVLQNSLKVAWTERQVLEGRDFDYSKRFLPDRLSGVDGIRSLNEREKLKLNQIMGNAYLHIFAFVEEYIIPQALEAAERDIYGDETRLRSLLRFAEDESKHQALFRKSSALFEKGFGVQCGLIPGREAVAKVVLSKSRLTSYLLTSMIEWFTQLHYVEHVKDGSELDGLFRDIVRYHWMDEAQHAKIDSLLIDEIIREIGEEDREKAVDELLELGGAVDGLLSQQADLDLASLEKAIGRTLSEDEKEEIKENTLRAYRWTFLVSGLEHPNFVQIVSELTDRGPDKLKTVARALSN